ncbi:MAG: ribosome-associated translation inhibitor RaiA [Candidatus Aminicenantes bacterium]|nr:ribosome-associated translation inhibitor RaiA [Candidatus Aminicenantes bacterium]MBL7082816.1 ribosome-associated translation inhibitor RaiA [Candidatus Aminicenantes bacterium]
MNINFTARHANITPEIKQYCEKRLKSLEKVLGHKISADIILSVEKYRNKAEINIKIKRSVLNVVEETHDMFNSLGLAFDNVEKRAKKEREKLRERKRRKTRDKDVFSFPVEKEEREKRVIRSQYYSPKPMTLEEAFLQFDLNRKEVFVFRKLGSEKWAVIYRRKDGNYGLVEPE